MRSAVPTGRVKWYEKDKGFGFLTSDDGGDVFVHKAALPAGVEELRAGQRVEFGVVDSRKGAQALSLKLIEAQPRRDDPLHPAGGLAGLLPGVVSDALIEAPPSVAELRRRPAEELHGLIEDMIKVLEAKVMPDLRRNRFPDKKTTQTVAQLVHAVARELET